LNKSDDDEAAETKSTAKEPAELRTIVVDMTGALKTDVVTAEIKSVDDKSREAKSTENEPTESKPLLLTSQLFPKKM